MVTKIELKYNINNLINFIGNETFNYHYGKHYQSYVDKTNELIKGHELDGKSIEEIVKYPYTSEELTNNSNQVYNHQLYFEQFTNENTTPSNELLKAINDAFESFDKFKEYFKNKSNSMFGSGYVWLILRHNNKLGIISLNNADNPLTYKAIPLLTIDLWEHSFYLDYKNKRSEYIENFFKYIDWNVISDRYRNAIKENEKYIITPSIF